MTTLGEAVTAACAADANAIHVVPDRDSTHVRIGNGTKMKNWRTLSHRAGAELIREIKQTCDLPVRRDIELSGEGVVYTNERRAVVHATTAPYGADGERASLRLS